ncbi:SDR family NAD(P)-dependent oxidoreductase [Candidatus Rhodobacter oscarellae]|uniref:SDR family NAD(P)-dependent oxidoreductase n=1 Tax=Candidatus Rhodobacter oscarellae TaxID=1675527 RepID=UPI000670A1DA|nr:SDR family oxidoreductase [Candidatus Rhodobacter lobularis]
MTEFRFEGRTALISGGAGDIGQALAKELIAQGMKIVIADINPVATGHACDALGPNAIPFIGDLTDDEVVARLMATVEDQFGALDVLIPNAAITDTTRFHVRSTQSIRKELEINLISPLILMRLAIPLLQKSDDPRVLVTTSLGGIQPLRETSIYSSSKFGLRGACLSVALDEELHGIKFTSIAPTATDTQQLRKEAVSDGNVLNFIDVPQTPQDVARTFLRALKKPRLEVYPKASDSILSRIAMLFPNLQPRVLPFFEAKGRRGLARYLNDLKDRGLVVEENGQHRLVKRPGRDVPAVK